MPALKDKAAKAAQKTAKKAGAGVRKAAEKKKEEAAAAAETIRDKIVEEFRGSPLQRRILFIRADEAPITRIQDRARAHVLLKLLNHPDTDKLLSRFQEMALEEYAARVQLEINPASLA